MGWFSVSRIGVSDLHHGRWIIGADTAEAIRPTQAGAAGIDVRLTVLTAQDYPFGEHRKTLQCHRTVDPNRSICQNPVVECQVDTVVMPVECHRLHINISIE